MANDERDLERFYAAREACRQKPDEPQRRPRIGARGTTRRRTTASLVSATLAVIVAPIALAAAGDDAPTRGAGARSAPLDGGERNPARGGFNAETAVVANNGRSGLVIRPSNTAKGGRAISATCDNDGLSEDDGCAVYVNKGQGAAATFRTQGSVPFALRPTNNGLVRFLNADLLDGQSADAFLGRTDKAADADKLDGVDSNALDAALLGGRPANKYIHDAQHVPIRQKLNFGDTVELVRNGLVSLVAQCRENISGTQDELRLLAQTYQDGAFMQGDTPHGGPGVGSNFLNTTSSENDRTMGGIVTTPAGDGMPAADDDIDTGFVAGPNGEYIGIDETTMFMMNVGDSDCLLVSYATVG